MREQPKASNSAILFDIFYQILRCFCHPVSVVQLKIIFQYLSLKAMISVGQTKVKSRG